MSVRGLMRETPPLVTAQVERLLGRVALAGKAPAHQAAVEHFAEAIRRAGPLVAKRSPDLQAAARALLKPSVTRLTKAAIGGATLRGAGSLPPLFACVTGTIDGREATVGCHVTAMPRGMAGSTSIPAALAAGQLLAARPAPGAYAPESVIDADRLLSDLIPWCTTPVADVDQLAPVQISFGDERRN